MGDQAFELDIQEAGEDWHRLPRRCVNLAEAQRVAANIVDVYINKVETLAVRFRKVD